MFSTVLEAFTARTEKQPGEVALLTPGKRDATFGDLFDRNEQMRQRLSRLGLTQGARVGLVISTRDSMVAAHLAVMTTAVSTPINPRAIASEIELILPEAELSSVIIEAGNPELETAASTLNLNVIRLIPDLAQTGFFQLEGTSTTSSRDASTPEPEDIAVLFRTSGTTARPKVVPRTQKSLVVGLEDNNGEMQLRPGDRVLNAMPLHHVQGLSGEFMYPLLWGASVAIVDFSPTEFFTHVKRYRPTKFTLVPSMHRLVLRAAQSSHTVLADSGVRWIESSSAALSPASKRDLESAYRVPIMQGYGATEAGGMIAPRTFDQSGIPEGSVGKRAHVGVVIMDESGNIVSRNVTGEICVKSSGNIPGYLNNPEANSQAFRNGYYRTGDLGYIDDGDYLFVVGRYLDTINRGGAKFSPAEIDHVLMQHEDVIDAAAFGVEDDELDQEVWAAVVIRDTSSVTTRELRAFAATRLDFGRVPKRIIPVDDLPYNEIGELMRLKLSSMLTR